MKKTWYVYTAGLENYQVQPDELTALRVANIVNKTLIRSPIALSDGNCYRALSVALEVVSRVFGEEDLLNE